MKPAIAQCLPALSMAFCLSACALPAAAQTILPTAVPGYTVSVFATGTDKYTKPDSIAFANGHVFIGFGGPGLPDGTDGKSSYILEYTLKGTMVHVYTVPGHNDGVKTNPDNGYVYAMQNEDAFPNLVIIDPATRQQSTHFFAALPPHGGGYDDMVFRDHKLYLSCSNPANNPNTKPAIVLAKVGTTVAVSQIIAGTDPAIDITKGGSTVLNLQDPDSMTLDADGDLFLDSQGDSEVVIVRHPDSRNQSELVVPLTSPFGAPQLDDSLFVPSKIGFILLADTPANTVYAIHKDAFAPGVIYSGGVGAANTAGFSEGFVGKLDLDSGYITPVIIGLQSPHGMAFIPADGDSDED